MSNRVGQQLGNYRVVSLLGQGCYAHVYLGQHLRLHQQVVIKELHTHLTETEAEQFSQEIQTIARFVHPAILRVLDSDVQDGVPFLVMDYVPNGSLRRRYPRSSLVPPSVIVSSIKQVADALQYAHDQQVIHRDVRPANMLLGWRGEVLLSDFGIATVVHSSASLSSQVAMDTLTYMAPEQIEGHPCAASDQYALGVVAYEWLTGEPPFSWSVQRLAMLHLSAPPPPLQAKLPAISSAIENVVLQALAKEPELRFQHVQAFALALEEAYRATLPGSAHRTPASEQSVEGERNTSAVPILPTGTVTLLFTDIEESTHLLQHLGDRYAKVLAECQKVLRSVFQEWNGYEVDTQGDAFFVAFARATDAVLAAAHAQRRLAAHAFLEGAVVRVRMGLHTGEPSRTAEGYAGLDVHRAARITSAAHGGQVM